MFNVRIILNSGKPDQPLLSKSDFYECPECHPGAVHSSFLVVLLPWRLCSMILLSPNHKSLTFLGKKCMWKEKHWQLHELQLAWKLECGGEICKEVRKIEAKQNTLA